MAPAVQRGAHDGDGSPYSLGKLLGARLVELGRLRACSAEELLVIEASPAAGRAAGSDAEPTGGDGEAGLWGASRSSTSPVHPDDDGEGEPIVEADLTVDDFDLGQEEEESWRDLSAGLPELWAPGSARGRRLMVARAKQCVICMEDKEHTLVPPHKGCCTGTNLEGHRLCTDCWEELLQHGLDRHWEWQHRREGPPPQLTCPVCRVGVEVPDAWSAEQELPNEWVQRSAPRAEGSCHLGEHPAP